MCGVRVRMSLRYTILKLPAVFALDGNPGRAKRPQQALQLAEHLQRVAITVHLPPDKAVSAVTTSLSPLGMPRPGPAVLWGHHQLPQRSSSLSLSSLSHPHTCRSTSL
jgi:hypothetical protein